MPPSIQITECPRDAMQGLSRFVPTELKAAYINLLLKVGFDTIDFGSFVSPRAIPQMRDTARVLQKLDLAGSRSKLLAIIANYRGAQEASEHRQISFLGFPFSLSETFQQRNAGTGTSQAFEIVKTIKELAASRDKELLVYLSMGFGNPYGDLWNNEIVMHWAEKLIGAGITYISIADTIGIATPQQIRSLYSLLSANFPKATWGVHLHSAPETWLEKMEAAFQSGCLRFDTALKGYGGCPMAKDELTGNIATEKAISYLQSQKVDLGLDMAKLQEAMDYSVQIFG
jgi:hydroxymethylglutaryl-CoA lyase